ncbi:hypothetical protein TBLA_0D04530 [Henningerozyma blattae CBS 6284]|uniref:Reverse transcriptase Ty1/copia-type domain-containing protein n=1 Tax=Henningerozyma blattae (strain ATCC 34711 / CBS 6284 / DSM 70876 / NBRC 10599 / NRRL Y-10934 / UCD 77-7) TaxID=1071380 RepID=I2H3J7_HENB6|nr:hypothetical protein TBLA_0D04530 [Tetrapisispora blattae CBS 6284]CCH60949.1 hypothetical protein TBLA_0D04530 [Tetrapisispora blattae CBS 6284]
MMTNIAKLHVKDTSKDTTYIRPFSTKFDYDLFRSFLALSAKLGFHINHLQFTDPCHDAVLRSTDEIYVKQPPLFNSSTYPNHVWKLKKPIPGLRIIPLRWAETIKETLIYLGFKEATATRFFFKHIPNDIILAFPYGENVLFASSETSILTELKKKLKKRFSYKDQGELKKIFDLNIMNKPKHYISITCDDYVSTLIEHFDMTVEKPILKPLPSKFDFTDNSSPYLEKNTEYHIVLGYLTHISDIARPDILSYVNLLSKYAKKPRAIHFNATLQLLGYVFTTRNLSIRYTYKSPDTIKLYSSGSEILALNKTSFTYSNMILLGDSPISWYSKQISVFKCTSLPDAEIFAAGVAVREVDWLDYLIEEINYHSLGLMKKVSIMTNKPELRFKESNSYETFSYKVKVRYAIVQEALILKTIILINIPDSEHIAKILTDVIPYKKFLTLRKKILVKDSQNRPLYFMEDLSSEGLN